MVTEAIPDVGEFRRVAEDFFTTETAVTFGGVFGGISVGELVGAMVAQRWSGMQELGINIGGKAGASLLTRYATKGRGTLDAFGMAMAAGMGASAVSDIIAFALDRPEGYHVLEQIVGTPQVVEPPTPENNNNQERRMRRVSLRSRSDRDVPSRRVEEEYVEGHPTGDVI